VARDRQRSKARQRARAAQDQRGGRKPRRTDAPETTPDTGLDESSIEDSGLVAPGFDHNANAEMVEAAEAGVPVPDEAAFEFERTDRAPDELELPPDLQASPAGRRKRALDGEESEVQPSDGKDRSRIVAFIAGCIEELRRVQWPDRPQVFQATAVVLGFVLVAGGYLGLMDAIWQPLINAIL
jgi:preprotein translocase SecE subunit